MKRVLVAVVAVTMSTALAACSSNTNGPAASTNGPAASGGAGSSEGVGRAQSLIDQYSGLPKFVSPGEAIDGKQAAQGKSVFSLPSNTSVPFIQDTERAFEELAKEVGLDVSSWPNQGQTAQYVEGLNTALSKKVGVISLLDGTDPKLVQSQLAKAREQGIKVLDAHDLDFTQSRPPNVDAFVDGDFVRAGELVAAWAITQTQGKANMLLVTSKNYNNNQPIVDGMKKEFAADCPNCKIIETNVDGPDWATKIQPAVQSAIVREPGLNYVLTPYDSMLLYVVPGIRSAQAVGRVHAASFNGTPAVLDLVRDGSIVTMDLGENPSDIAAATLDQSLRLLSGKAPAKHSLVTRVFSKTNAQEAGVPAQLGKGYGDAWLKGYRQLLGLG